ncbi:MAG: exodeoxyribonuclease VII small subunit [Pseudomonadota bacterium]
MEEIAEKLESDDVELEPAIELYEKGVKLIKEAQNRLAEAEQRINMLTLEDDDDEEES